MNEQTRRGEAISQISALYPPDSGYADTAEIGMQDMLAAIASHWRSLPVDVLEEMARTQIARDNSGY